MLLKELFKQINDRRLLKNLPLITEERFIEEISVMEYCGKIMVKNGEIFMTYL